MTSAAAAQRIAMDDGVHLAVRVSTPSSRDAVPVLFVHGWMASGAGWDALRAHESWRAHASAHVREIVPDLRGSGASDKPASGYTLDRYGKDLVTVLDALGVDRVVVVGHSMGGQLTQWLCARHPQRVRAALALCPVPASGLTLPPEAVPLFSTAGGDEKKLDMILGLATKDASPAARAALLDDAKGCATACVNEAQVSFRAGFADDLAAVRTRFLVVASEDPFLPVPFLQERIVARIPGARMAVIAGAGHYPQSERPSEMVAVLQAFLAGVGES